MKKEGKEIRMVVNSFWVKTSENKWQNWNKVKIKKNWYDLFPKIVYYLDGKEIKEIIKKK